ncbi:hypothetical protein OTU49_000371 [Cherax quadricarinatus]|uniref:Peptidase M28 domain-containing protein n=1 Tax=Cherax quadricarinatus TaxID=27406 RepID=A0AAW0XYQ7_CHEQU
MAEGVLYCTLLVLLGSAWSTLAQDTRLMRHLEHFTNVRNPAAVSNDAVLEARAYIKDQFSQYGLQVRINQFSTNVVVFNQERTVIGENIIGIARGYLGSPVLVVGADYDSTLEESPLENNGAGVAALLEIARNYMRMTGPGELYRRVKTVLFVAFDLNTREYANAQSDFRYGLPGSYHFLHQFLWPFLNQSANNFQGAIILDSISKFSERNNTQYLPPGFDLAFPEARHIGTQGAKGNFMALFSLGSAAIQRLTSTIISSYSRDPKSRMMRIQELLVNSNVNQGSTVPMFNHQSHFSFWTFQPADTPVSLPAVLLTDTGVYRSPGEECSIPCSAQNFLTPTRHDFIRLTTRSLTTAVLQLQAERTSSSSSQYHLYTNDGNPGGAAMMMTYTVSTLMVVCLLLLLQ